MATDNDIAAVGGFAVLALVLSVVAITVGIARGGSSSVPEGVTGFDLRLAVDTCTPYNATFEQELACYQAVYGSAK